MSNGIYGQIVSWRVPAEVGLMELRSAMAAANLDPGMAMDLLPANALRRSLGDMRAGRVIRKLRRDGDSLFFQLTREYLGETEITYEREAEVAVDCTTGAVTGDNTEICSRARELLTEHLAKRRTSDLTRLVHRLYDRQRADLVPIREQGGAYFVPQQHADLVTSTKILLDRIGGNLRSFDVRFGGADTAESVAESMAEYLGELVRCFRDSCKDVDVTSRSDVIERRYAKAAELRQRLESYRTILGAYVGRIAQEIDEADKDLLTRLNQLTKAVSV